MDLHSLIADMRMKIQNGIDQNFNGKQIMNYIYRLPPDSLVQETLSIFQIIRYCVLAGITVINPLIGVLGFVVDKIIEEKVNEHEYASLIKKFEKELEGIKNKAHELESSDMKEKTKKKKLENIRLYRAQLEKELNKLRQYYDQITEYKERARIVQTKYDKLNKKKSKDEDELTESASPLKKTISFNQFVDECAIAIFESRVNNFINICEKQCYQEIGWHDVTHAAGKVHDTITHADKTVSHAIDSIGDSFLSKIKNAGTSELRQEIMHGQIKLSMVFKHVLAAGAIWWAISPYVAVLAAVVWLIRRGMLKETERHSLMNELHAEMEIVEEKIKDAASDGDKKKKYDYIRLRREIQKSMDKLNYGKEIVRSKVGGGSSGEWD